MSVNTNDVLYEVSKEFLLFSFYSRILDVNFLKNICLKSSPQYNFFFLLVNLYSQFFAVIGYSLFIVNHFLFLKTQFQIRFNLVNSNDMFHKLFD